MNVGFKQMENKGLEGIFVKGNSWLFFPEKH